MIFENKVPEILWTELGGGGTILFFQFNCITVNINCIILHNVLPND